MPSLAEKVIFGNLSRLTRSSGAMVITGIVSSIFVIIPMVLTPGHMNWVDWNSDNPDKLPYTRGGTWGLGSITKDGDL